MMLEVRFPQALWTPVEEALRERRHRVHRWLALGRVMEGDTRVILLAQDVIPIHSEVEGFLKRWAREGAALLEIHMGPPDRAVWPQLPCPHPGLASLYHGSLRLGTANGFEGHVWNPRKQTVEPIHRIRIVGLPLQTRYPAHTPLASLEQAHREIFNRQIQAFGEDGQRILQSLAVGVVGVGGLGQQIVQALGFLGVSRMVLVDPDRLEWSNAHRAVMVRRTHVRRRVFKVRAVAQTLAQTCPVPPEVIALPISVTEPEAWQTLLTVDVLIGAVDSALLRQFLNVVAVSGLIPYLDGGVGIQAREGRIQAGGGQVQVVVPGMTACLACLGWGGLQAAVEQMTPEEQSREQHLGYIQGANLPHPQVVFLNGVVAHLLVGEFVKLVTGCAPVVPYIYYDLLQACVVPVPDAQRRPDCFLCAPEGVLAQGIEALRTYG